MTEVSRDLGVMNMNKNKHNYIQNYIYIDIPLYIQRILVGYWTSFSLGGLVSFSGTRVTITITRFLNVIDYDYDYIVK